jgi:hypothetical protein
MAAGDVALLTGISVYPNEGYAQLNGPPNDLKIIKEWLLDPAGGGLLDKNIIEVASPNPYPSKVDPDSAPPISEDFDRKFKGLLRERMALKGERVKDRLYLYFSGHGFCNRSQTKPPEAALYSANATREFYEHIFGTYYARVAVGWALFAEVVLIMDCCRDSVITREPTPKPYRDTPDDGLSAQVKLMCIYAVPKGGKAQEREIPERGNKVHGLLTHALIKALNEAQPTRGETISASELRDHIFQSWTAVCGADAAPCPEISPPPNGEIYFHAKDLGGEFEIRYTSPPPADWKVTLRDGALKDIAHLALVDGQGGDLLAPDGPLLSFRRNGGTLKLRLKAGFYEYETNPPVRIGRFKVDGGGGHVDL